MKHKSTSKKNTRKIVNPFEFTKNENDTRIYKYEYTTEHIIADEKNNLDKINDHKLNNSIIWLNIDGSNIEVIKNIAALYNIHDLLLEDILSHGQRPKYDEVNDVIFTLLYMLYYNDETKEIEIEQISIALTYNTVLCFQENSDKDVFKNISALLKNKTSKLRNRNADYLFYALLDTIVNSYYKVIEKLGIEIENLETTIIENPRQDAFKRINQLRKELILLKRNTLPVRDLIAAIMRMENNLLEERTKKYLKDVYDQIMQANELTENYRELTMSLQDLYLNTVNLKMNEIMKTLAILTAVMAPATVIGGIFGMNFEKMPIIHNNLGFLITVGLMILIPIFMLWWFFYRGWFKKEY